MKRKPVLIILLALVLLPLLAAAVLLSMQARREAEPTAGPTAASAPVEGEAARAAQIVRGAYLARAGNCIGCHTQRGGPAFAGGRAVRTPFGEIYAPNITPDRETGIGDWNADDFWRALHLGRGKDGRYLYPAFPYPDYTKVTRADSDAIHAWLQTVAAVRQSNRAHALRFPFNQRYLLAFWRALYFRPGEYVPQPERSASWNRGAYLVQGPGHCSTCHTSRNALGGSQVDAFLAGGIIPAQDWYASPLSASGLGDWQAPELQDLLSHGVSARAAVSGPMAEVVGSSLQYLEKGDIAAIADYLKSLPATPLIASGASQPLPAAEAEALFKRGASLYEKHCVDCHQANGRGAPPAYPPLAGNRAVAEFPPVNAIRIVLNGGFAPSTAGNPRPYGMPPFGPLLSDEDVAAVLSYVRQAWGNQGSAVAAHTVAGLRSVPAD